MDEFYLSNPDGSKTGPISKSEVQKALDASPDTAASRLVWSAETVDWVSPELAGFEINKPGRTAPQRPVPATIPAPTLLTPTVAAPKVALRTRSEIETPSKPESYSASINPYNAPKSSIETTEPEYPGFGRLTAALVYVGYFSVMIGMGIFEATVGTGIHALDLISGVSGYVVEFFCVAMRFRNMGQSGWRCFMLLIPIYNIWVLFLSIASCSSLFKSTMGRRFSPLSRALSSRFSRSISPL